MTDVSRQADLWGCAMCQATRVTPPDDLGHVILPNSIAAKVFSTNTAFEAASGALQIFGENGLTREYPIEKLLRDARASMIEDGCNDVLSLVGAARLAADGPA